jgi:hypothetical protein
MAYAEGANAFGVTFRQVIDKALFSSNVVSFYYLPDNYKDFCFIFELTSPETRVVKRYTDYRMNLIGLRERTSGIEWDSQKLDDLAKALNVPRPKQYVMSSFEEVVKNSKELPELDEGYVCVWEDQQPFYRLKIKNPAYLAVSHMRDNGEHSEKRVICLVMSNNQDEYLSYFPEDRPLFQKYVDAHEKMKEDVARTWDKVKDIQNQKEFALLVKDLPVSGILFRLKKGDSYEQIVDKLNDNSKINIFRRYMEK